MKKIAISIIAGLSIILAGGILSGSWIFWIPLGISLGIVFFLSNNKK